MDQSIVPNAAAPKALGVPRGCIEFFAELLSARLGLQPGADGDDEYVARLGGRIHRVGSSQYSLVVRGCGNFDVYIPSHSFLSHEHIYIAQAVGCYYLHHPQSVSDVMLVSRHVANRVTWEAGVFAEAFLVPEAALRTMMTRYRGSICDIASAFDVPILVIKRRIGQIGLMAA